VLSVAEDHVAKIWDREGKTLWQSPADWKLADAACSATTAERYLAKLDGTLWKQQATAAPVAVPTKTKLAEASVIALAPDGRRLAAVDVDHRARLVDLGDGSELASAAGTFKRSWEPRLVWAADGSVFVVSSDSGAVVYDGATAKIRFEIPPPGGLLRRIAIDPRSESIFVSAFDAGVRRYSLRDGREVTRYRSKAFAWGLLVIESRLYVGYDDASVIEYSIDSGEQLSQVGSFGGDVFTLGDAGNGLLWVGTVARTFVLVDRLTRAVLFHTDLPTEPIHLTVLPRLGASIGGLTGAMAFVNVDSAPASVERLDDEVKCRTAYSLVDGTLAPRAVELDACARLRQK